MPTNKRQKIVDLIVAKMKTILTAGGYETNIGTRVEDWRTNWQEDELPAISVCDLTEEVQEDANDEAIYIYKLPVEIRVYHSSSTRAADGRKHIADVLKAIRTNPQWIDGANAKLALKTDLKQTGFVMAEDGFRVIATSIGIEIYYYTNQFDYY